MKRTLSLLLLLVGMVAHSATSFPTTGDKVETPAFTLSTSTTALSCSFVLRLTETGDWGGILYIQATGDNWVGVYMGAQTLYLECWSGATNSIGEFDYTAFTDTDAVVTVVYDGGQSTDATKCVLYINGVARTLTFSAAGVPSSIVLTSATLDFGDREAASHTPIISEVAVWRDVALTQAQVTEIASRKGYPMRVPDAVPTIYIDCVNSIVDRRGYAGTPTLTGTAVATHPRILR